MCRMYMQSPDRLRLNVKRESLSSAKALVVLVMDSVRQDSMRSSCRSGLQLRLRRERGKHRTGLHHGQRSGQEEALGAVAIQLAQALELRPSLDALGDYMLAQRFAQADDRADDLAAFLRLADLTDERAVDLQARNRQCRQVAERRVTGSEIVHAQAHAQFAQLLQRWDDALELLHQRALGDLQHQARRRNPGLAQRFAHKGGELRSGQVLARNVDVYAQFARRRVLLVPLTQLATDAPDRPVGQLVDQRGLFGHRNEGSRTDLTALRVVPAHQRLETDQLAGFDPVQRL